MCINCNILTPLSDEAADLIGVEKRKYIVIGSHLDEYIIRNGLSTMDKMYDTVKQRSNMYLNDIINYQTAGGNFEIIGNITRPSKTLGNLMLFEGKYKQLHPIDNKYITLDRFYPELFIDGKVETY